MTRTTLRFVSGSETCEIAGCDPTLTVLDWLRLQQRRTGTKEGCAEGDCGACTVVVGRMDQGRLRYEAINACIRFLPSLDGCHLLTVEHLRQDDGSLHPVQQAMVDHHGAQCGFCTPGIVMSLYALWLNEASPSISRIEDALAGNLCRCTGYRPIIDAARAMYDRRAMLQDTVAAQQAEIAARLTAWADDAPLELAQDGRHFLAPVTTDAFAALYAQNPMALIVAGSTDIGLWVTKGLQKPEILLSPARIPALRQITSTPDATQFGAMVSVREVRQALSANTQLNEMLRRFGGEQIRNAGTIGGNIGNGSPIGDLPPALIALGAHLTLRQGDSRRELPLEEYFLAYRRQDRRPGEFIEQITVPHLPEGALFHISKISKRFDEDISTLCAAFRLVLSPDGRIAGARLAYGGMAATPKRASHAEAALRGKLWDKASVRAAIDALAQDFTPLSDMRASSTYRLTVAGNLLHRFLIETTEPGQATRVSDSLTEAEHG